MMPQFPTTPVTNKSLGLDSKYAVVRQLIALAVAQVPGHPAVGITTYRRGELAAIAALTPRAQQWEQAQLTYPAGPVLECFVTACPVTVADLMAEHRWPDCIARLVVLGVRSLHCQPLIAGRNRTAFGVLTFYSPYRTSFGGPTERIIQKVALRAATILARDTAITA
ncbi:hypothetical protein [Nocardia sp. NBC_01009]|uniref:hypothetical protein n=1 Tax=Nocardia sp. NBC_01009 TaxID=2975996 RepID=UPI00386A907A|nr:GAF domain-containing protein [Nocardia sp. NBC_01009]